MFQPVPMAKVAVVGPKQSLAATVDTLHRLNLLHIEDFTGSHDKTFDLGSPLPGGSKISERLVRIRGVIKGASLQPPKDARPFTIENLRALEDRLQEVEDELARLVEERGRFDDELKTLAEEDAALARIANLPIRTDLTSGFRSVATVTGFLPATTDLAPLRAVHADVEILESMEAEGRFIVAYAPRHVERELTEAAARLGLTPFEVPAHPVPPAQAREQLARRRQEAQARRDQLDQKIGAIRERHGAAFFALDEYLGIEADKATSPVRFRTTAHSFMIEGWIPHDAYARLEQALQRATRNTVYVARLQRAAMSHARVEHHGGAEHADEHGKDKPVEDVPVMLKNPNRAGPYELLTDTYSRPKYGELDPTLFMYIGFPFFFGMMLGDMGYGLILLIMLATGAFNALYKIFGFQSQWHLNRIFLHSAIATILFGALYSEFFGFELFGHAGIINHFSTHIGPIPYPLARLENVKLLLALSLLVGVVHLFIGLVLGMRNAAAEHGMNDAIKHRGSWLCILIAVALAGFAVVPTTLGLGEAHAEDDHAADDHGHSDVDLHQAAVEEHDTGSSFMLWTALVFFIVGVILLVMGEGGIALLELPSILSNLLSYTRLVAIGLSGVGIALAGNKVAAGMIGGTIPGGVIAAVFVAILFHSMGVLLGIIGPALHSLRLHYVEFFTKFYAGGGTPYAPFGAQRKYTVQEVKQA